MTDPVGGAAIEAREWLEAEVACDIEGMAFTRSDMRNVRALIVDHKAQVEQVGALRYLLAEWERSSKEETERADRAEGDLRALREAVEAWCKNNAFGAMVPRLRTDNHNGAYDVVVVDELLAFLAVSPTADHEEER